MQQQIEEEIKELKLDIKRLGK